MIISGSSSCFYIGEMELSVGFAVAVWTGQELIMTLHRPNKISEKQISQVREQIETERDELHRLILVAPTLDDVGAATRSLHRTLHERPWKRRPAKAPTKLDAL
jgi:hypothetical protein